MITFADLKKYRYFYWCALPALVQKPGWEIIEGWRDCDEAALEQVRFSLLSLSGAAR